MSTNSTDLIGQTPFLEEADRVLTASDDNTLAALLLVSLHGVRAVNRELGYAAGDRMLELVLNELKSVLREQDAVTRIGSEFLVFLPELVSTAQGVMAAQRFLAITESLLDIAGNSIRPHLDVGIAFYPDHAESIGELLRSADLALGEARRRRVGYWVHEPDASAALSGSGVALEGELARALDASELAVHYQPLIDVRTGRVCGLEALARWQSPTRGAVSPAAFIPVAENSGLIRGITNWVLNTALRETQALRAEHAGMSLAVNLSATVLHDPDTVALVGRAMKLWDVAPGGLTLEITESAMMDDPGASRHVLERLSALGAGVAIDDFGTGYSSLAYLTELPCTELKIDRSFVMQMLADQRSATIVRAVTRLAHTLDLDVVAEGVESAEALTALEALDCDKAQGFLISRPMPVDDLIGWLSSAAWSSTSRRSTG
ncbi:MAG: bifunctional diguanylate cyclase/phosphodiesterase [Gammaproteobacteria bacterium]|nr:bifunctional diguanylate cyclase/phosphodiesterase [Gammaproteobacteria bacterium]MDJ0872078.1 bifunctional diguanylate cyclase/phosphodiesterase [Gammaproteobacteria bacterium]